VHAAGVFGHVAADRAGDLARGVGRVIEAALRDRVRDREVRDPGLAGHAAVVVVDVENAIEAREAEHDAVGERQRTAGE